MKMSENNKITKNLIDFLIGCDYKMVLALTGGGSGVVGRLLRSGGGSNFLLEAYVPYSEKSLIEFIGGTPDKFCSATTARQLALTAYLKACHLDERKLNDRVLGIGATCSLAKQGEREGRQHKAFIALQAIDRVRTFEVEFSPPRDRMYEEFVVENRILSLLGDYFTFNTFQTKTGETCQFYEHIDRSGIMKVLRGEKEKILIPTGWGCVNKYLNNNEEAAKLIFPGSFFPCHSQHVEMMKHARKKMGNIPLDLEISLKNVDKPFVDLASLESRLSSVSNSPTNKVWVTRASTFLEKAKLFPCSTFVVGDDTLSRINDVKYYKDLDDRDESFNKMKELGIRFLSYSRLVDGVSLRRSWHLSNLLERITILVPEADFAPVDISSSNLRREQEWNQTF